MISYTDKVQLTPNPNPDVNQWKADDANEVKTEVNTDITNLATHTSNTSNPHSVTKTQVGLGNVDNTSDVNKPVSSATQTALNLKADITYVDTQDAGKQPIDSDLTTIAGLTPSNDDFLQRKSGAWANRTIAQVKTDLDLISQTVTNGVTTKAPSEDAVFDAIAAIPAGGDVDGPASSTTNTPAFFDGTTGKLLKQSPGPVDWTTGITLTGFSATTIKQSWYIDDGYSIALMLAVEGTGSGTTVTITLPVAPNATIYNGANTAVFVCQTVNNITPASGMVVLTGGSTAGSVFNSVAGAAFTIGVGRIIKFSIRYFK